MPLTQDQENREHEPRIGQMTVNIEKMRNDMEAQQKWETRKFLVQLLVGVAACVGARAALATYVNSRPPLPLPPPAPPQIIYLVPGPPPAQVPALPRILPPAAPPGR